MFSQADVLAAGRAIEATFPPGLTSRARGYTSFMGGQRLYNKLRRLDTEAEFEHLIRSFNRLSHIPSMDQSLTLAIAFRESGPLVLRSGRRRVDTFEQGGLDRLYREGPRLRAAGLLPADVQDALRAGSTHETEGSTATRRRHAAAAMIAQRDLLVAYGAVIADRANSFRSSASTAGLSVAGLNRRAERIWTALFFGGPNGLAYETFARLRDRHESTPGWMGSNFGARTVMTFLVSSGLVAGDLLRLDQHERRLYETTRVMSAFIVTAEAELLDWVKVLSR